MKANLRILAASLLTALLFSTVPFSPVTMTVSAGQSGNLHTATDTQLPLGCSSIEELSALLELGAEEIELSGDILLSQDFSLTALRPVHIDMGQYGIRIESGARLYLNGTLRFTGSGTSTPLFSLENGGELVGYSSAVEITATGNDAIAMELGEHAYIYCPDTVIEVTGNNSIALKVRGDARLDRLRAEAGNNGTAISATGNLTLESCSVYGAVHTGGILTLDCTAAEPLPENARIISRKAHWLSDYGADMGIFGFWAVAGQQSPLPDAISLDLIDRDGAEELKFLQDIPMLWEANSADLSAPGTYTVYGTPQIPELPHGVGGLERTAVTVQIVEPGRPWLIAASVPSSYVSLHFMEPIEDAEDIRLYHSLDGETWTRLDEDAVWLSGWSASIQFLQPDHMHYFQLEVVGGSLAGRSNTLSFYLDADNLIGDGGDRDNGDRGDQGENPPEPLPPVIPPPDPPVTPDNPTPPDTPAPPTPPDDPSPASPRPGGGTSGSADKPDTDRVRAQTPQVEESTQPEGNTFIAPPMAEATPNSAVFSLTAPQLEDQLAANPESLTITKNGIKAVIPAKALAALELREGENFSAELNMPSADRFSVRFWVEDREITDFGGEAFELHIPSKTAEISCLRDGETLPAVGYENGRAIFSLWHTGEYDLLQESEPHVQQTTVMAEPQTEIPQEAETVKPFPWYIPILTVVALCAVGFALYRRRKGAKP